MSPLPIRRLHRITVSAFFFLAGLCFSSWASRIADIQLHLGLDNAGLGAVLLGLPAGLLASLPLAGWMVARFGSRPVALFAAFLYAVTLPVLGVVQAPWQLVACLFVFGMGGNLLNISINTQAIGTEALYGRTIMASYHGLWSLAGFTGAALGTLFIRLGWVPYQHFLVITGLAFTVVLLTSGRLIRQDSGANSGQPIFAWPDKSLINLG